VETEIYESDPFSAKKQNLLVRFTSDYRFQKGDEIYIHQKDGRPLPVLMEKKAPPSPADQDPDSPPALPPIAVADNQVTTPLASPVADRRP